MPKKTSLVLLLSCITLLASCTAPAPSPRVLIVGGGSSHDFDRWFHQEDASTLRQAGFEVSYTDDPAQILPRLAELDVLYLSNNQPLTDPALRTAIFDFADAGKGLLLVHPAVWYNWEDWPQYNRELVGGGSRSHGPYGPFEITVTESNHPITAGVPATFTLEDELYRFEANPNGPGITTLVVGTELDTGQQYPLVWTLDVSNRNIVGIALGHDGKAHGSDAYKTLLQNAAWWLIQH